MNYCCTTPLYTDGIGNFNSDGWKFIITGAPNKLVGLQRTSDFTGWWDIEPPVFVGAEGMCEMLDTNTELKVMFYRVMVR
jgi:hypothetical protein